MTTGVRVGCRGKRTRHGQRGAVCTTRMQARKPGARAAVRAPRDLSDARMRGPSGARTLSAAVRNSLCPRLTYARQLPVAGQGCARWHPVMRRHRAAQSGKLNLTWAEEGA